MIRYLYEELGFHGNVQDYYDPRNSFLNDVLDRRTGIPITLSTVYIAVGRRAGSGSGGCRVGVGAQQIQRVLLRFRRAKNCRLARQPRHAAHQRS